MGEISEEPQSNSAKQAPQKTRAEENPWYLLATLYGVPVNLQDERRDRNRCAWNRYFAANLDEDKRALLTKEGRHSLGELTSFSEQQLLEIGEAFAERSKGSGANIELPARNTRIDFSNVQFDQTIDFSHHIFIECLFKEVTFFNRADFRDATFLEGANFASVDFGDSAWFHRASFYRAAEFELAHFHGAAEFESATFSGGALFKRVTFATVSFRTAVFFNEARFDRAIFERESEFANAKMKDMTWFEGATFKTEPPKFFGCELHEGTVWPSRDENVWPLPKGKDEAKVFVLTYGRLKLEMDRLKKHEDELDFFALELQSHRVLQESVIKGSGLPIALYGFVSDYGRSYARPLYALFVVAAFGTLLLLLTGALAPWQSLGLSFANTLNVFGFRKDFFDSHVVENLPAALKILASVQTILGTILLFLFGLGIRNKFRMK